MSRPIQAGDIAQITILPQKYDVPITGVDATGIRTASHLIVPQGNTWQIKGYPTPHTVTFLPGPTRQPLKILTLNLGYNVMSNQPVGSEAILVKACQTAYKGGWKDTSKQISACTYNAAQLISKYTLFGLQEVHATYAPQLIRTIQQLNPNAKFRFIPGSRLLVGFDENVTGEGIALTPIEHKLVDRGLQAVWFPKLGLLFINLHAPHGIDLISEIKKSVAQIKINPKKVIMVGDFNDYTGFLRNKSIDLFGFQLRIPKYSPPTCCADSGYAYPGDYIFTSHYNNEYYGYPEGYTRGSPLISDHDPIVLEDRSTT